MSEKDCGQTKEVPGIRIEGDDQKNGNGIELVREETSWVDETRIEEDDRKPEKETGLVQENVGWEAD